MRASPRPPPPFQQADVTRTAFRIEQLRTAIARNLLDLQRGGAAPVAFSDGSTAGFPSGATARALRGAAARNTKPQQQQQQQQQQQEAGGGPIGRVTVGGSAGSAAVRVVVQPQDLAKIHDSLLRRRLAC